MKTLRIVLTAIMIFAVVGIATTARGAEYKYLDEMHDEDTTQNQIKGKAKIAKYCNSLTKYGYTDAEVRGCIGEKSNYHVREKLRVEVRNECLKKYVGKYEQIVNCVQARYKEIRRGK